jgi:hypothetical protein
MVMKSGHENNHHQIANDKSVLKKKDSNHDYDDNIEQNDEFGNFKQKRSARTWNVCKRFARIICITKGKRIGNYLLALFVFVKILYTFNSIIQLFILNHFLGNEYLLLGVEVISKY